MVLWYGRVNLGMVLSLLSSILSLPLNKRWHAGLGFVFVLLSAVHTWQHRRQFRHYWYKERQNMGIFPLTEKLWNPSTKIKLFLEELQVLHYMPGRVRLYSRHLLNNPEVVRQVSGYLENVPEIREFSINAGTGSLLIQYSPADVARNPLLRGIEQKVVKQYGRG